MLLPRRHRKSEIGDAAGSDLERPGRRRLSRFPERSYKPHLPKVRVFFELEIAVMSLTIRSGLLLSILCAGVFAVKAQDKQPNRFVSNDACKTCHPIIWSTFYKNPHFKSIASGKEPPESTGCQGCHGPGGKHVDNGGGAETIVAF